MVSVHGVNTPPKVPNLLLRSLLLVGMSELRRLGHSSCWFWNLTVSGLFLSEGKVAIGDLSVGRDSFQPATRYSIAADETTYLLPSAETIVLKAALIVKNLRWL